MTSPSKKKAVMLLFIKCVDPTGTYWFLTKIIDVSLGNPNIQAMHQNSMPPPSAAIRKHLNAIRKQDGPFSGWKVHALHHGNCSRIANDGELRVVLKYNVAKTRELVAEEGTLGYSDEKCMEPWRVCFERMVEV